MQIRKPTYVPESMINFTWKSAPKIIPLLNSGLFTLGATYSCIWPLCGWRRRRGTWARRTGSAPNTSSTHSCTGPASSGSQRSSTLPLTRYHRHQSPVYANTDPVHRFCFWTRRGDFFGSEIIVATWSTPKITWAKTKVEYPGLDPHGSALLWKIL